MPLTRDKIIGFDSRTASYRFVMMDGNRPVECRVSNAVFNYLEKSSYPANNPDALFLRWRATIEQAMSDKFDADGGVYLFMKDLKTQKSPG
jgi:hypothetical protein